MCYNVQVEKYIQGDHNSKRTIERVERNEMTGLLSIVMNANGLFDFGVCDFARVEDRLLPCMAKGRLPKGAKAVISVLFPYKVPVKKGNLSLYATVPDYHEIAGHMLDTACIALRNAFGEHEFVWFIDNSPIPEVYAASLCGLGMIGDNGLLINEKYGTYCFIGEIVTDLDVPVTGDSISVCEHCGACRQSCPGKALSAEGFVRDNCLSYITQKKGTLTDIETELIRKNGSVWGCDVCQDVCPHNKNAADTYIEPFLRRANPDVTMNDLTDAYDRAYMWRGPTVIQRNLDIIDGDDQD